MSEETKSKNEEVVPDPNAGKPAETEAAKASVPDFAKLQGELSEIRGKFAAKDTETEALKKELEGVKGATQIVDRLKKALGGEEDQASVEQEKAKAEFYRLLVNNPTEAIRQVYRMERQRELAAERERDTEVMWNQFQKLFPEYKDYEEDMKAELLANPGWFDRPNFIQRVFFDVLSNKNPELLSKIIGENRGKRKGEQEPFLYEGGSNMTHGPALDGQAIMDRMRSVAPKKSYFE